MDLSRVIVGPIVTEKAERQKAGEHTFTLQVNARATKVDIKAALRHFYDLDAKNVRIMWTRAKTRVIGAGKEMEKRHAFKKALITLPSGTTLDLASFKNR